MTCTSLTSLRRSTRRNVEVIICCWIRTNTFSSASTFIFVNHLYLLSLGFYMISQSKITSGHVVVILRTFYTEGSGAWLLHFYCSHVSTTTTTSWRKSPSMPICSPPPSSTFQPPGGSLPDARTASTKTFLCKRSSNFTPNLLDDWLLILSLRETRSENSVLVFTILSFRRKKISTFYHLTVLYVNIYVK